MTKGVCHRGVGRPSTKGDFDSQPSGTVDYGDKRGLGMFRVWPCVDGARGLPGLPKDNHILSHQIAYWLL